MKTKATKKNNITWTRVSKGVHKLSNGSYVVRKMINGVRYTRTMTNKTKAAQLYKTL